MKSITSSKTSTGVAVVASTLNPLVDFYLNEIKIHLSAAGGAGILTISVNSIHGSEYDVIIASQDMTAITDLVFVPDPKLHLLAGDIINVNWANANGRTYGIEMVYTKISEVF